MPLFRSLGFSQHPFSKTNADEEPDLSSYFVPPPYFDAVVGDSSSPSASVVLAPRGAGKTALRRMVEAHAINSQFLAVTYDRFEFSAGENIENVSLQYHLRNIITRVLISFLSYLSEYPDVLKGLSKKERSQLSVFVSTYLGDLTGDRLQELMNELKSLPEKFKRFWSENVGFMESVVNFVLKSYGLESIDVPDVKMEEKRLSETYKYQLEILLSLVRKLRFKSIYILIDRTDETEKTGNNPEATYTLIQPLLRDLELLGMKGFGFKFFLWDKIEPFYRKDARPDRVAQYNLTWTSRSLKTVLFKRMESFSEGKIKNMQSLMSSTTAINIDDALCVMAHNSPRNLIRACEKIFAAQAERNPESAKIDIQAVDSGVLIYSEMLCKELYGEDYTKDIQKVGRELFTTNYIANDVFKISGQGARNKITAWSDSGLVAKVGTVVVPPAKRPVNFYCVTDPVAVRLIHRTVNIEKFIQDRWVPCDHCLVDNLIDIDLYPEYNEAVCRSCGRELI